MRWTRSIFVTFAILSCDFFFHSTQKLAIVILLLFIFSIDISTRGLPFTIWSMRIVNPTSDLRNDSFINWWCSRTAPPDSEILQRPCLGRDPQNWICLCQLKPQRSTLECSLSRLLFDLIRLSIRSRAFSDFFSESGLVVSVDTVWIDTYLNLIGSELVEYVELSVEHDEMDGANVVRVKEHIRGRGGEFVPVLGKVTPVLVVAYTNIHRKHWFRNFSRLKIAKYICY